MGAQQPCVQNSFKDEEVAFQNKENCLKHCVSQLHATQNSGGMPLRKKKLLAQVWKVLHMLEVATIVGVC